MSGGVVNLVMRPSKSDVMSGDPRGGQSLLSSTKHGDPGKISNSRRNIKLGNKWRSNIEEIRVLC